MPRAQIGTLTVDYVECGNGIPLIFIPGLTEFKEAFAFQFRGLEDSYRVISYDVRRGMKRTTDYTLDLLVDDLRKFLQALDLTTAVICGHSFGGLIAMQFAAKYPDVTDALILVSTYAHTPLVTQDRLFNLVSSTAHPFHKSLGTSFRVHMSRLLGRKTSGALVMQDQFQAMRMIARQGARTSQTTVAQRLKIMQQTDLRDTLPQIVAPTLVVAGAKDRPVFLSGAQELYEGLPNASLEVIEDGGHFCFVTRHDQFNTLVDDFLTDRLAEIS